MFRVPPCSEVLRILDKSAVHNTNDGLLLGGTSELVATLMQKFCKGKFSVSSVKCIFNCLVYTFYEFCTTKAELKIKALNQCA